VTRDATRRDARGTGGDWNARPAHPLSRISTGWTRAETYGMV